MMRLDEREWKTFHISDLFTVKRPAARNKDDYKEGPVPFVASGSVNNGVMKCCQSFDDEKLDAAGCITVSPVDGSAFYQPYDFLGRGGAGSSILMLYRDGLNLYTGQFIAKMVSNTCSGKYDYGHMGNKDSIKREQIMLPVTDDGNPDFQFMEDFIRELIDDKKKQYRGFIEKHLSDLSAVSEDQKVDWKSLIVSRKWEPFYISHIFDETQRGKRIVNENHVEGNTPLVSSQGTNNGVTNFIGNEEGVRRFKNCLSIANGGSSAGKCYYQPFEFVGADHVTQCFRLDASPQQYLFLSTIVSKALMGKYGFSHEIKDKALVRERILLPVTADGQPDYIFMEDFGTKLMLEKYRQYLRYLENNKHYKLGS